MTQEELQNLLDQLNPNRKPAFDYVSPDDPSMLKDDETDLTNDNYPQPEEIEPDGNIISSASTPSTPNPNAKKFSDFFPEEKKEKSNYDYLKKYENISQGTIEPELFGNKYKKIIDVLGGAGGALGGGVLGSMVSPGLGTYAGGAAGYVAGSQAAGALEHFLNNWSRVKANIPEQSYDIKKAAYNLPEQVGEAAIGAGTDLGLKKVILPALKNTVLGLSGVPKTALETLIKNPKRIEYLKNQPTNEIFEKFGESVSKNTSNFLSELEDINNEFLTSSSNKIDVNNIIKRLQDYKKSILPKSGNPVTDTDLQLIKTIDKQSDLIKKAYPNRYITPKEANTLLTKMGQEITWNPSTQTVRMSSDPVNKALSKEYGNLNEDIINSLADEGSKTGYKANTATQEKILDFTKDPRWKQRTDLKNMASTANQAIGSGIRGQYDREAIKELDDILGTNYSQQLEELGTAQYFKNADHISGHATGRSTLPYELAQAMSEAVIGPSKLGRFGGMLVSPNLVYKTAPTINSLLSDPARAAALGGILGYINQSKIPEKEMEKK